MKSFFKATLILALFISANALAHPGDTDDNGCHTCSENCEKWGLAYGKEHCHQHPHKKPELISQKILDDKKVQKASQEK